VISTLMTELALYRRMRTTPGRQTSKDDFHLGSAASLLVVWFSVFSVRHRSVNQLVSPVLQKSMSPAPTSIWPFALEISQFGTYDQMLCALRSIGWRFRIRQNRVARDLYIAVRLHLAPSVGGRRSDSGIGFRIESVIWYHQAVRPESDHRLRRQSTQSIVTNIRLVPA
jgi:hypothetical protein